MNDDWSPSDPPVSQLPTICANIYYLLAANPSGLDITQIRSALGVGESQEHLTRRVRDLRKYYEVRTRREGGRHIYILKGRKRKNVGDSGSITTRLRAEILHQAQGRCQMCGASVQDDGARLQIDHKIPLAWGGLTTAENLWAICVPCNHGKRDYFASFDEEQMKEIVALPSVHERIAHLLRLSLGEPVPSRLIEFVANATERQEDWHKRLRELRYEPIGLQIESGRLKNEAGYIESTYTLKNWRDIPLDHKNLIREWEKRGKKKQLGD